MIDLAALLFRGGCIESSLSARAFFDIIHRVLSPEPHAALYLLCIRCSLAHHRSLIILFLIATECLEPRQEKPRPVEVEDPWGKKRQFDREGQKWRFLRVRQRVSRPNATS